MNIYNNETMDKLINKILEETNYRQNPYFVNLENKEFEKEDFLETQIQFYFAVIFFNRPMSALAAKILDPVLQTEILRNVWEELGKGEQDKRHGSTFIEFLFKLGKITIKDIQKRSLWPELRIFNTSLIGACTQDEYLIGAGVMGIIEYMFSDIAAIVGNGVIKNGWVDSSNMVHYNVHETLDIRHSEDFFNVLKPAWKEEENRYYIEQGLRMGAKLFNGLYNDLYSSRKNRMYRTINGPHIRL